jgi:hypothetical protein
MYTDKINTFSIVNGVLHRGGSVSFEHAYLPKDSFLKMSPDNKHILCTYGKVYSINENGELGIDTTIKDFKSTAFNIENNRFYTAVEDGSVYIYDYENFSNTIKYKSEENIESIYYSNKQLILLLKDIDGIYSIEAVNLRFLDPAIGDYNNDDSVDISDLVVISLAFGSIPGDVRWDKRADLNNDGKVDILDFLIFKQNYGK